MGALFVYVLKSAFCLAAFFLFYRLLLSKETFYRFNRFSLLGMVGLSYVLPLAGMFVGQPAASGNYLLSPEGLVLFTLPDGTVSSGDTVAASSGLAWPAVVTGIYMVGAGFFFFRGLWALGRIVLLSCSSRGKHMKGGVRLVIHNRSLPPFSWMNYIFIAEKDWEESRQSILIHELAHVRNRHSWDLLLAELCVCLQWFNPAAWLLKLELQDIHEYEADASVLRQGVDARQYQLLLIEKAVGPKFYSLADSFSHSSLKKRIAMMLRKKSSPWARMKCLYVFPLAAVAVTAFARPEMSQALKMMSSVGVDDYASVLKADKAESRAYAPLSAEEKTTAIGVVLEKDSRKPVAGASVVVKGTSYGTLTHDDGRFMLQALPENSRLMVSMSGYVPAEIHLGSYTDDALRQGITVLLEREETRSKALAAEMKDSRFQTVDVMPEYPGGMSECMKFMSETVKYPSEAYKRGIEGRVIVGFVVNKDGNIADTKIVRSVDPTLDEEALRVIGLMPKWKPGMKDGSPVDVTFAIPVTFSLTDGASDGTTVTVVGAKDTVRSSDILQPVEKEPLVVIDGVETDNEMLQKLSSERIASVHVLKGESAEQLYGEKGRNGVILVKTKQQK